MTVSRSQARLVGEPEEAPPQYFEARAELAQRFLFGSGLEIGGLNWPLEVPAHVRVKQVDRMTTEELRVEYPEMREVALPEVEVIDDGETLATIPDGSQDFIVANHFLEHCGDPIGTIGTHLAKLKPGGILFYAVPDKRYTFDFRRPLTTLEHVILDHEEGPRRSRREHFDEWTLYNGGADEDRANDDSFEAFAQRAAREARRLEADDYSIHTHVWTQATFLELVLHCRAVLGEAFDIEAASRRTMEFVIVLRKRGPFPPPVTPSSSLEGRVKGLEAANLSLTGQLEELQDSLSWRVTGPLREAMNALRRFRGRARGSA